MDSRQSMRAAIAAEVRAQAARVNDSQASIAEVLGTSEATISRKMRGLKYAFDADELLALAAHWDVPVTRLLPPLEVDPTTRWVTDNERAATLAMAS